jgi:hypothetical protein
VEQSKRCSRCRRHLPVSAFGVRRASSDGLQNYCRACFSAWAREHRPRKTKDVPQVAAGEKWCRRCEQAKPVDAFARNATTTDGLQAYCRTCAAADYRARREALGKVVRPPDVPEGHKFCRTCRTSKPFDQWSRNASASDGLQTRCKGCISLIGRESHLRRSYGLTVQEVDQLVSEQGGLCAICVSAPAVHVDHDHATGSVRGLLCFRCNAALGQFDDNPATPRRAAEYLDRARGAAVEAAPRPRVRSAGSSRSVIELAWAKVVAEADFGTAS